MGIFRREPPPPPPSKLPSWVQLVTPIIFAIIMALSGLAFNGFADNMKKTDAELKSYILKVDEEAKKDIDELQKEKVDNQTMQLMIKLQEQQMKTLEKNMEDIKDLLKQQNKDK